MQIVESEEKKEVKEYTVIWFDYGLYNRNKRNLKKIRDEYGLVWNEGKITQLSWDEIIEAFKLFGMGDKISRDTELLERSGSAGVWQSDNNHVKIIMFEKKNEEEHLPVLMVYKGNEGEFYKKYMGYCKDIGCEIAKIVDMGDGKFEEVFKKRINVELIGLLGDNVNIKEVLKKQFMVDIEFKREIGIVFSDEFVKGWVECIDRWGLYTDKMLYEEISKKYGGNKENENGNNVREESVSKGVSVEEKIVKTVDKKVKHKYIFTGVKS